MTLANSRFLLLCCCAVAVFAGGLFQAPGWAQTLVVPTSSTHEALRRGPELPPVFAHIPTELTEYTSYCPLWRTDGTFRSIIRLTNRLQTTPVEVTVTLYMADDTPLALAPVQVPKGGVATVDVNSALANAPSDILTHVSSFGSAALRFRYDWEGAVNGTMAVIDVTRSLDYTFSFVPPTLGRTVKTTGAATPSNKGGALQVYEGLWWRHTEESAGFVAIFNTTGSSVSAELSVLGLSKIAQRELMLPPRTPIWVNLKDFFAGEDARVGGIRLTHPGEPYSVLVAGGLEDPASGYSATLPIDLRHNDPRPMGRREYAAVGIMVNAPDSDLRFPAQVTFSAYAFFRNVADGPRTLRFRAYFMTGGRGAVDSRRLSDVQLQPGQSYSLPIADLMKANPEVEAVNLVYSYDGASNDIFSAIGSVDPTGNYVFPVPADSIGESGPRFSPYWIAGNGFSTMYTLWNPDSHGQDYLVTITYGENGETWRMPVRLEPYASTMLDMGVLIDKRLPDQDGKVLPRETLHGTFSVTSPANDARDSIRVVVAGGIYNPTKATCGMTCVECPGFTGIWVQPIDFIMAVSGQQQNSGGYTWSNGYNYNIAASSYWSSSATSLLTVQTYGESQPGLASGIATGNVGTNFASVGTYRPYAQLLCGFPADCASIPASQIGGNNSGEVTPCGNAIVDTMHNEYQDPTYQTPYRPECYEFANAGGTTNFTWNELNGGFGQGNPHSPWGIVTQALRNGLEETRTVYNRGGIRITSGYRCPHGNAQVGGVANSPHIHGSAADMYSDDHPWTQEEFNRLSEAARLAGAAHRTTWDTYADRHLHARWD